MHMLVTTLQPESEIFVYFKLVLHNTICCETCLVIPLQNRFHDTLEHITPLNVMNLCWFSLKGRFYQKSKSFNFCCCTVYYLWLNLSYNALQHRFNKPLHHVTLQSWPKILGQHFVMNALLPPPPSSTIQCCEFLVKFLLCIWPSQHHPTRWNEATLMKGWKGEEQVIFPISSSVRLIGSHLQRCPSHYWPRL